MSSTQYDRIERQLIEAHLASGQPRYSTVLKLADGAVIRRWTGDQDEALARHAIAADAEGMTSVVTFDHLSLHTVAADFPAHGKTAQQLKAECDAALDAMLDRWLSETCH